MKRGTQINARFILGLLLATALTGCVVPSARDPIDSVSSLSGNETILVGRVELIPPLKKHEQKFKGIIVGDFENKIILLTDDQNRKLTKEPELSDYAGRIEAKLGETFFVRSPAKPFYILGGVVYLELGGEGMSRAYFPGGIKVSIRAGDQAVYVGTLRYHRNEFFDVTKVDVQDEFAKANAEFKKKFGSARTLHKALLTPVK